MDEMGVDTGNVTIQRVERCLTKFVWTVGLFGLCNKDSKSVSYERRSSFTLGLSSSFKGKKSYPSLPGPM